MELSTIIKAYENGNEKDIISLFEKVFHKPMGKTESIKHWQWAFFENPVKPVSIMLAWHRETLIGQYAASPSIARMKAHELTAALSLNTMTDPDYGGRGIFSETAKSLYNEMAKKRVSFVYGFPNSQSVRGFVKHLGWQIITAPPILICPLDLGPYVKNKTKCDALGILTSKISKPVLRGLHKTLPLMNNNIEIRKEKAFEVWSNELWLKCRDQHKLWIVRDYIYLSWRYNMRPESQYSIFTAWINDEIAGYVVTTSQVRDEGNVSFILDILADVNAKGVIATLLMAVINQSIKNNDALISAMIMPASIYRKAFNRLFFIPLPQKLFPQQLNFGGRLLNDHISRELFYDPNSWYISWGDTDLL